MVRKPKIINVGVEQTEAVEPAAVIEATMAEGEVGGFAPGVVEHIMEDTNVDHETQATSQDLPTRPATGSQSGGNPQGNGSNQPRTVSPKAAYNALKGRVQKLGETLGGAKTSMIALAEVVTEAAQDGAITVEQVPEIYDRFKAGVTKASTYEDAGEVSDEAAMGMAPAKSIEQQLSKLRQFVILGGKYESDALDLIRKARNMHIEMLRAANGDAEVKKGIKPGSTYSVLVDVARAQLKKQKEAVEAGKRSGVKHTGLAPILTDKELRDTMTQAVPETQDKTGEDYLLDTLVKAKATRKGSAQRNAITSTALDNAIEWLRTALGEIAPDMLTKHDKEEADAAETRRKAAEAKAEAEAEKARKASEPKLSKAERQAQLAATQTQPAA